MRFTAMMQTAANSTSAKTAPACFASAETLISIRTLNSLLGVFILSVLRLSVRLHVRIMPARLSLN